MQKFNSLERMLVGHVIQECTLFIRSRCWVANVATYGYGSVGGFRCLSRLWSSLICCIAQCVFRAYIDAAFQLAGCSEIHYYFDI
jgi:hypothetical protein